MGTIERRGKGSWRVSVRVNTPDGPRVVRETVHVDPDLSEKRQRREAEAALNRLQAAVDAGEKGAEIHYTVRAWSDFWLENEIRPNCSPVTYGNYRYLLDSRILPALGDERLENLTAVSLTAWMAALREEKKRTTRVPDDQLAHKRSPSQRLSGRAGGLSAKTLLNYYACMDAMLASAVRMRILPYNPMGGVPRPRARKKRAAFLTEEEAVQLLRCLTDEPNICYRAALLLALICGLRLGEVCALKLSDVDWEHSTIDISRALKYVPRQGAIIDAPKTDAAQRIITLPAAMIAVLRQVQAEADENKRLAPNIWQDEGWIVHGWDGRRLSHDTPSKWFRRFADKHGFEGLRFHDLRHTHATLLLANNIDVVAVAHRMGHSDPSVTLRVYAHALARRDVDAAHAFDRLLQPPAPSSSDAPANH